MKKAHPFLLLALCLVINLTYAQVAINTTGNNANGSAMLDVESTTKGMLIPRMTTAQRIAIASPASGLLVYDNTTFSFWFYNGSAWTELVAGVAAGWKLTGNSGTDTSLNFVGTTDNADLKFRVNNLRAGTIATTGNVFLGVNSGIQSTGMNNTGIGGFTLSNNTTGYRNTAVGRAALYNSNGLQNSAFGFNALFSNTTGTGNTGIGDVSLQLNTTGNGNTALGQAALFSNTTGYSNVAVGIDALLSNTIKSNLIAIGDSALYYNGAGASNITDAIANTAVGSKALYLNTTGSFNNAIGYSALRSNTTGFQNIGLGSEVLLQNTTGSRNIAIGFRSLLNNSTATSNTAIGDFSMYSTTTGGDNSAYGSQSLFSNTIGSLNTAIGGNALNQNVSGLGNTAVGYQSLFANTTGYENISIGEGSLVTNTTGFRNTVIGGFADVSSSNLFNSTAIGHSAYVSASNSLVLGSINGVNGATSDVNVGIGITAPMARLHIKHNSYPVPTLLLEESENDFTRMRFINTNANSFWEMNALPQTTNTNARIEFLNSSANTVTTPFVLYGNGNATLSGMLTQNSDFRLKKNIQPIHNALDAIQRLNGYSYNWKDNSRDESLQMGVIAQEVQKVFPSLVKEDNKGVLSVNYSGLIPVLIEAIKEQQKQIDELKQMLRK